MIDQTGKIGEMLESDFFVELYDVQGLFGGRNVLVSKKGTVWIQSVRPHARHGKLVEKLYKLTISDEEVDRIRRALVESDFLSLGSDETEGIPDQARPEIVLATGEREPIHAVEFWEGRFLAPDAYQGSDRSRFDTVYRGLLRFETVALERARPVRKGTYKGPESWKAFKKREGLSS